MITTSGSELDAYSKCPMLHTYRFGLGLEPNNKSKALEVGTAGHALLAPYYRARLSGADHKEAMAQAEGIAAWELEIVANVRPDIAELAMFLVRAYWAFYPSDDWQILAVEREYRRNYDAGELVGTIDLLVDERGILTVVDHRFLGRFYDEDMVVIDPQLPRYALLLARNGHYVERAYRNMVSTASKGSNTRRVQRLEVPLNAHRLDLVENQTNQTMSDLAAFKSLPLEYRRKYARRTFSPNCRFCEFKTPCAISAEGGDDQPLLDQQFSPSRYGYAPREDPFA
jgi:hypothetical protein